MSERASQRLWRRILREPLTHFLVVGLVLFIAGKIHQRQVDTYRIVVTPQRTAQIATRYALQFGKAVDAAALAQLVENDIDEEILFRRGLALELDKGDEIVRRRIVQKMRFLLQDLSAPAEPGDTELRAYYSAHAERYTTPASVTFSHVYFSSRDGDQRTRARALAALDTLAKGRAPASHLGDPFPDLYHFAAYEPEQVRRLFGRTPFSEAVFSAPLEQWVGPYASGYGWHLIRVEARQAAEPQALSVVRDRVRTDYLLDAQTRANLAAFNTLAREFTVVHKKS